MKFTVQQALFDTHKKSAQTTTVIAVTDEDLSILGVKLTFPTKSHHESDLLGSTLTISTEGTVRDSRDRVLDIQAIRTLKVKPFTPHLDLLFDDFKKPW